MRRLARHAILPALAVALVVAVAAGIARPAASGPASVAAAAGVPGTSGAFGPSASGAVGGPAALFPSPSPWVSPSPIPSAALTEALGELRRKYGIPGMQATIIWPDGRSWSAITGFANLAARVKVTRATPFSVGSITKTFVAALILRLAEEGRLSLEDPVARWLPGLPATKVPPTVTIRQLLDHTSGVYDYFSNDLIDPALTGAKRRIWTIPMDMVYVKKPYFPAGTDWHYSNTNYIVLGQIAELAGGASVPAQLRARFIGPLRLLTASYQGVELPRLPVAHAYTFASGSATARPIDQSDGTRIAPFTSVTTAAGPAGSLAVSSWDLARWAQALYGGRVLQPDSLAAMTDVSAATLVGAKPYGLALQELTIDGWRSIGHGGRLIGSQAVMRYFPDLGVSIAVTTNQWRTSPDVVVRALAAIALPPAAAPTPSPSPSATPSPTPTPFPTPTPSG